jgi:hypothetical protein
MATGIPAVQVVAADEAVAVDEYGPSGDAVARLRSAANFPLWLISAELPDGATMDWDADHGEEVVYVETGQLAAGSSRTPEGGAVVLEAGCPARLVAEGPTRVLHFGSGEAQRPAGPQAADHAAGPEEPVLHVVGPRGTWAMVEEGRDSHYYADSTCPSCDVTLLYTSRQEPWDSSLHSHSTDELIHVMWGDMQVGRWHLGPGGTVAIRADATYQFKSGPSGLGFLNFRAGPSTMRIPATGQTIVEGGEVNRFLPVMDLR